MNVTTAMEVEREATLFLYEEAEQLDTGRLQDWLQTLHPDIDYRIPVRQNVERAYGTGFSAQAYYMEEDHSSITMRIARLDSDFAWAENPRSRTRRMVSNVRLLEQSQHQGAPLLLVASNTANFCHRGDVPTPIIVTYDRRDHLVRTDAGLRLLRRVVRLDSTVLGLESMSFFL